MICESMAFGIVLPPPGALPGRLMKATDALPASVLKAGPGALPGWKVPAHPALAWELDVHPVGATLLKRQAAGKTPSQATNPVGSSNEELCSRESRTTDCGCRRRSLRGAKSADCIGKGFPPSFFHRAADNFYFTLCPLASVEC